MVNITDIKADLPDWPDEVIEHWLLKLANRGSDTGWPPPEPLGRHAWNYILGRRPLSWWKKVAWSFEELDLEYESLSNGSKRIVSKMIEGLLIGVPNLYSADSKERFVSAGRYLVEHGTLPGTVVVMRLKDGLSVIDGNHRVTALFARRVSSRRGVPMKGLVPAENHQVWVGTHASGEVPLD